MPVPEAEFAAEHETPCHSSTGPGTAPGNEHSRPKLHERADQLSDRGQAATRGQSVASAGWCRNVILGPGFPTRSGVVRARLVRAVLMRRLLRVPSSTLGGIGALDARPHGDHYSIRINPAAYLAPGLHSLTSHK